MVLYYIVFMFNTVLHYLFKVPKHEGALVLLSEMVLGFYFS